MLAEWPAGRLEAWHEYYKLEPWGDDWERSSLIAAELMNAITSLASGFAGDKGVKPEPIPSDAFVPYRRHDDKRKREFAEGIKALESLRGL